MDVRTDRRWWAMTALGFFAFMTNLDSSVVNIAVPVMAKSLNVTASQMVWATSIYLIVVSALLLLFGKMGDLIGKPRIFKWGTAVFILGSVMAGINLGFYFLLAARVVQATGAAMTLANTYGIVTASFEAKERGRAMGFVGTFVALGAVAGPSVGGLVLAVASWPVIFWLNVPFGLIALALAVWAMGNGSAVGAASARTLDWLGILTQAIAIAAGFWGLNLSQSRGFSSPIVLTLLLVAGAALILFLLTEHVHPGPLLPLTIFKNRLFSLGVLAVFFVFMVQFFTTVLMPFYLEDARGLGPGGAGALLTLYPLMMTLAAPLGGWLADRFNAAGVALIGAALIAAGSAGYLLVDATSPLWRFGAVVIVLGLGSGIFQSPIGDLVMSVVPKNELGIAGSFNALARNLGMVAGTSVASTILFARMSAVAGRRIVTFPTAQPGWFIAGMHTAMLVAAALALIAVVVLAKSVPMWRARGAVPGGDSTADSVHQPKNS
ncbi:MFS transporter [Lacticaseibacillus mingshuiensis]|uniref:MFS transporter n=1 Tax=Lacticaseibacillus mingshuiensis TaxID=2799574 RepID=A0ABW4CFJ8_9LACO|nr:MFS transporter [Lacticaseibacillus mingshuiensis]